MGNFLCCDLHFVLAYLQYTSKARLLPTGLRHTTWLVAVQYSFYLYGYLSLLLIHHVVLANTEPATATSLITTHNTGPGPTSATCHSNSSSNTTTDTPASDRLAHYGTPSSTF